jgi:guanosine-3',5'-bis(diphosphate) 3'-pyrophosphohydrolase
MKAHKTFDDLVHVAESYLPAQEVEMLRRAYELAFKAHDGQARHSGEAYITHPVEVTFILAELHQDAATLCAGLLHDTVEDTSVTAQELELQFGPEVCRLVEGVTKLSRISFDSKEEAQAENLRKMFLAMAKDIRVVIIKLADRLHNMRTLKSVPPEKQMRISKVTRDIFAPLAHRLGMWRIKWELEDLAFYHLQYQEFQEIKRLVASRRDEREGYIHHFTDDIKRLLAEHHIPGKVTGRPKHFYSIYCKLVSQDLNFDELYDAMGVRVIVEDVRRCYETLGVVHAAFKPINGRFKDYIAMPKSNYYQSLHTTVMGPGGRPVEIQIRTVEMDQLAEYGVAAHWRYKEGDQNKSYDADFAWLRQILDHPRDSAAPQDFLQTLKMDLFLDEVFVFTPKGEVQVLQTGATPLDFAYKIHTEIGHCCIGAKVNGHIVNLDYTLSSGDRVEILTSKKPQPKSDWLLFVQSSQAKQKIKQWFKRQNAQDGIQKGKIKLEKTLLVAGHLPKEVLTKSAIESILKERGLSTLDEIYLAIFEGDLPPKEVADQFLAFHSKLVETPLGVHPMTGRSVPLSKTNLDAVRVLGEDHVMAHMAKCCHPVPGEPIIGFVTIGHGVSIHCTDCSQVLNLGPDLQPRLVEAQWVNQQDSKQTYSVDMRIEAFDRLGILKDILNTIAETKTNIHSVKTKTLGKGGKMRATLTVEVSSLAHLNRVKRAVANLSDVLSIARMKDLA